MGMTLKSKAGLFRVRQRQSLHGAYRRQVFEEAALYGDYGIILFPQGEELRSPFQGQIEEKHLRGQKAGGRFDHRLEARVCDRAEG